MACIEQRFWNFAQRHVSSFLWNRSRMGKTACSTKAVRCKPKIAVTVHSKPRSLFLSVTVPLSWFRFYSSIHHFDLTLPTCISAAPLLYNLHLRRKRLPLYCLLQFSMDLHDPSRGFIPILIWSVFPRTTIKYSLDIQKHVLWRQGKYSFTVLSQ